MKFRFIEKHKDKYTVGRICALLGVSRSGFYAWKDRKPSQREQINQALIEHIHRIYRMSRRAYSSSRVYATTKKTKVCMQSEDSSSFDAPGRAQRATQVPKSDHHEKQTRVSNSSQFAQSGIHCR